MQPPSRDMLRSRPVLMRLLVRSWDYRHPRVWARVRFAAAIWNLGVGVLILVAGYWVGPLALLAAIPLAGAAALFWTSSRLRQFAALSPPAAAATGTIMPAPQKQMILI